LQAPQRYRVPELSSIKPTLNGQVYHLEATKLPLTTLVFLAFYLVGQAQERNSSLAMRRHLV